MIARLNRLGTVALLLVAPFLLVACPSDEGTLECPAGTVRIIDECVPAGDTTGDTSGDTITGDTAVGDADAVSDSSQPDGSDTTTGVQLPFAIDDYYTPSGYFPAGEAMNIDGDVACPARAGDEVGVCHGFTWSPGSEGFGGVWWQYPEGNWGDGDVPGLAVPAGATALTFWAWGAAGGESVKFFSGYASDGFELNTGELTLTTTPTAYTIFMTSASYTTIAGGFGWVATPPSGGGDVTIYIDDIELTNVSQGVTGCTDPTANNYDDQATIDDGSCTYDAVQMPFAVDDYYTPSGFMGDGELGGIDMDGTCATRAGDEKGTCHAVVYTPKANNWGGVFWQFPEDNWDVHPGLPIAAGAKRIIFWAWGASGGEVVKFLSGYASDGFEVNTGDLTLTTTPTEYSIDLSGATYTTVAGGFGWVTSAGAASFFIDDIEWTDAAGAPVSGCTDAGATNYNPAATVDDGSCTYPSGPATAAPTPTLAGADVTSIFSDAYTDVAGVDTNPGWGQATVTTTEMIQSNATLKLAGLDYQGIDFSTPPKDLSGRGKLHLDFWTSDATAVNLFLISVGPVEKPFALPVATDQWVSVDIELSDFAPPVDLTKVIQLKFVNAGTGAAPTIYVDNIYFHGEAVVVDPCVPTLPELTVNGGFEEGDTACWTDFASPNSGTFAATMDEAKTGDWSGHLVASVPAAGGPASFPVVKQANLGIGTVTAGTSVTISFDLYGSVAGAGGVMFAEFFSEVDGGGTSKAEILGGGPVFHTGTWTNHTFTTTTGSDVSAGVTLQLKADCGANAGLHHRRLHRQRLGHHRWRERRRRSDHGRTDPDPRRSRRHLDLQRRLHRRRRRRHQPGLGAGHRHHDRDDRRRRHPEARGPGLPGHRLRDAPEGRVRPSQAPPGLLDGGRHLRGSLPDQ